MEMVLEYPLSIVILVCSRCFNPSSNGNGAGMYCSNLVCVEEPLSFNPSSNGNGAGIRIYLWVIIHL